MSDYACQAVNVLGEGILNIDISVGSDACIAKTVTAIGLHHASMVSHNALGCDSVFAYVIFD